MKKTLLSVLFITACAFFAIGQTTYVDYEGLNLKFWGWGESTFEVVSNPTSDPVNSSANVAKFVKGTPADWWPGVGSDPIGGSFDFSGDKTFTIKVLADQTGSFLFKLEDAANADNNIEKAANYTTTGAWQELTFDLASPDVQNGATDAAYGKIILIPDKGDAGTEGHVWYFDDITGPTFVAGADVDVTVNVNDRANAATTVEVEFSDDPGNKIALTNDGTGKWSATKALPGNNYANTYDYTYTIYVDGVAVAEHTDMSLTINAGGDPIAINYAFGEIIIDYTDYVNFDGLDLVFGGWQGSTFEVVDNPVSDGVNSSSKVGKFVKGSPADWWPGIASDPIGGSFDFSGEKIFKMKVLSEAAGPVLFKLEDPANADNNMEVAVDYTTPGEWQELLFDLSNPDAQNGAAGAAFGKFVLIPDKGNVGTEGHIWWFDDIAGPAFIVGSDVEVNIIVTDRVNASTSVEIELSNDAGNKIALTNDGSGKWSTSVNLPGNTYATTYDYTYTIYVNGVAVPEQTDVPFSVSAGAAGKSLNYAFGEYTPTAYINYEDLNFSFLGWGGCSFTKIPNPVVDAVNGSDYVGQIIKGGSSGEWPGIYSEGIGGQFDLTVSQEFTMKVYSDTAGPVLFKLENPASADDNMELTVEYTTPGQWAELTYDLSTVARNGNPNAPLGKFVIIPDLGNAGTGGHIWYFDDVYGPPFIKGDEVELTFEVTDLDMEATSVEVELSNNPGTKIPLTLVGDTIFTETVMFPGDTYKDSYTYTIYVDGVAVTAYTNKKISVAAGSAPSKISFVFGGGLTSEAHATYFGDVFPLIDGEIDEVWDSAFAYQVMLPFGSDVFADSSDLNGYFKVGWDEYGLYVLVVANDDYYYTDMGSGTYGEDWEKDKIEMYLDMNVDNLQDGGSPSQTGNAGTNGHFQVAPVNFLEWYGAPSWFDNTCDRSFVTTVSGSADTAVTGDSYTAISEFYISWATLLDKDGGEITPDSLTEIGFDLTLSDNDGEDNGAARNRMVWVSSLVQGWDNMDNCGTLTFDGGPEDPDAVRDFSLSKYRIYPNPVKDVLFISNSSDIKTVAVYNLLGSKVKNIRANGSDTFSLNTSDLNSGIYVISIVSESGVVSNSKFIVE